MPELNLNLWMLFLPFFIILVVSYILLQKISKGFMLSGPTNKTFSIFSLEFPGSDAKLSALIEHMDDKAKEKVRLNLYVDYLFMVGIYPSIAILCFIAAKAVNEAGAEFGYISLLVLGWAQIIPFCCDCIENQILLHKLKKPKPIREKLYLKLKWLVGIKFTISILAFTSTIFSFLFLWFIGKAAKGITLTIAGLTALLIAYTIYCEITRRKKQKKQETIILKNAMEAMEKERV